jgi:hypothetical protein
MREENGPWVGILTFWQETGKFGFHGTGTFSLQSEMTLGTDSQLAVTVGREEEFTIIFAVLHYCYSVHKRMLGIRPLKYLSLVVALKNKL